MFKNQDEFQISSDFNQTSAWNEEDENRFRNLIYLVEHSDENKATKEGFVKFINRLKFLKNRFTWKPTDEQIQYLTHAVNTAKYKNDISTNGYEPYIPLSTLLQQLKKLKG